MPRNILAVAIVGALLTVAPGRASRADQAAPRAPSPSDAAALPYTGPLKPSPSATYFPLRSEILMRSAPSSSAPVVSTLSATTRPLQALGMVVDEAGTSSQAQGGGDRTPAQTWIKLRLPSGASGFVGLGDLITPQQSAVRAGSLRKVGMFETAVATAKRIKGPDIPSGIYTRGGSCDIPASAEADVGTVLQTKVLIWQEGSKMHFVRVLQPDDPTVYDMQNDNQVQELRGFGYVPMRTFRSPKDAALMGFKDRRLWFSTDGQSFNSYEACDPAAIDATVAALRSFANQRPPQGR